MNEVRDKRKKILAINKISTDALKKIMQRRKVNAYDESNTSNNYNIISGYYETSPSSWSSSVGANYPTGD